MVTTVQADIKAGLRPGNPEGKGLVTGGNTEGDRLQVYDGANILPTESGYISAFGNGGTLGTTPLDIDGFRIQDILTYLSDAGDIYFLALTDNGVYVRSATGSGTPTLVETDQQVTITFPFSGGEWIRAIYAPIGSTNPWKLWTYALIKGELYLYQKGLKYIARVEGVEKGQLVFHKQYPSFIISTTQMGYAYTIDFEQEYGNSTYFTVTIGGATATANTNSAADIEHTAQDLANSLSVYYGTVIDAAAQQLTTTDIDAYVDICFYSGDDTNPPSFFYEYEGDTTEIVLSLEYENAWWNDLILSHITPGDGYNEHQFYNCTLKALTFHTTTDLGVHIPFNWATGKVICPSIWARKRIYTVQSNRLIWTATFTPPFEIWGNSGGHPFTGDHATNAQDFNGGVVVYAGSTRHLTLDDGVTWETAAIVGGPLTTSILLRYQDKLIVPYDNKYSIDGINFQGMPQGYTLALPVADYGWTMGDFVEFEGNLVGFDPDTGKIQASVSGIDGWATWATLSLFGTNGLLRAMPDFNRILFIGARGNMRYIDASGDLGSLGTIPVITDYQSIYGVPWDDAKGYIAALWQNPANRTTYVVFGVRVNETSYDDFLLYESNTFSDWIMTQIPGNTQGGQYRYLMDRRWTF